MLFRSRDRRENIGDGHLGTDGFRALCAHPAFAGKAFLLEVPGLPSEAHPKGDGPDAENVRRLQAIRDEAATAASGAATTPRARARTRA